MYSRTLFPEFTKQATEVDTYQQLVSEVLTDASYNMLSLHAEAPIEKFRYKVGD